MAYASVVLLLVFLHLSFLPPSKQATVVAPDPVLTLAVIDVELNEGEDARTELHPGTAGQPLLTCTDDDTARAYVQSVFPTSPCGPACFRLLPCGDLVTEFCLYFLASQGTLDYAQAPSYSLTIACTDDVEPITTAIMTVTIIPNTPPIFNPASPLSVTSTISGLATTGNTLLYDVNADDVDGDPVYFTMGLNPATIYMTIGYTSGAIRATNDLKFLCQTPIEATVTATDNINPAIGPFTIDFTISPVNLAPVVSNLDTTITVDENIGAGQTVLTLAVTDAFGTLAYNMRATSSGALDLYQLVGNQLRTRIDPNYERSDTRSATLYFDVSDGYCKSPTYSLVVNLQNVNEAPVFFPDTITLTTYEGNIDIANGMEVIDPDIGDTFTFTLVSDASNLFSVKSADGNIVSKAPIDIDNNVQSVIYTLTTRVTDAGGLFDNAVVTLIVRDSNDLAPYFTGTPYAFGVTTCTEVGTVLGQFQGDDDDSAFQQNDEIYFGGGGGKLTVMANGEAVLTSSMVAGESFTGSASIHDRGVYPGPLTGTSTSFTVTCCTPCPTTAAAGGGGGGGTSATIATTAAAATTIAATTAATASGSDGSGAVAMLSWIIPAAILGLLWIALTAYFIYRFCYPCSCPQRYPRKIRVTPKKPPKPKKVKPAPPPKPAKPKKQPPPIPPAAPRIPTPLPPPYVHPFWQEKYNDFDHVRQPNREDKPVAVEKMNPNEGKPATPPRNLRLQPEGHQQPKNPKFENVAKKRFCTIL